MAVRPLSGGVPRHLMSYTNSTVRRAVWHPDGRSLLFMADAAGNERYQLYLVDAAGGPPRALTDSPNAGYWAAAGDPFSPDGTLLAYAGNDRSPGDQDVLVRDLNTGEVRRVYAGGGRVYAGHWSPDGTRLTMFDKRGANSDRVVSVVSMEDGRVTSLTPDQGSADYVPGPWLPDGSGILVISDFGRDVMGLGAMDVAAGRLTWLDTPDWNVEAAALSRDGRVLAWLVNVDGASLLRARDLVTGEDLPTPTLPVGSASELSITSDGGCAVMLMSTPTRPANVLVVDMRGGGLRWLTDARRVGRPLVRGFGVLSCVSRLPEFNWAAAVAWCAPANLVTFARAQPPTWRAQVALMIGDPDTDAEKLLARSPVTYAEQITAPLFLIQGANDARVPRHESDQIVQQLRERGVDVRYDVYQDEGHVFGSRANQTKARSDAAQFLFDRLTDRPAPPD